VRFVPPVKIFGRVKSCRRRSAREILPPDRFEVQIVDASMSPQRLVSPQMDMGGTHHILKGFSVL
jgi:hypothetical protein